MFDPTWFVVVEPGIEDGDHLAHAGGERDFLVIAGGDWVTSDIPGSVSVSFYDVGEFRFMPRNA